ALAQQIIDQLTQQTAQVLLETAFDHDGDSDPAGLAAHHDSHAPLIDWGPDPVAHGTVPNAAPAPSAGLFDLSILQKATALLKSREDGLGLDASATGVAG
ncbi:MAG: hypothetical protein AAFR93_12845, partial [Pseudomonadota bacterium]